ncbi:MAG: hypothetical protein NT150_13905 [Bacteroidetes bacterium]|nr:hypothetical protein [Bacteroidota bacterium]
MNRNYIAENLCEKRTQKNNCCKGQCHLKKQIEKEENSDGSSRSGSKEKTEEVAVMNSVQMMTLLFTIKEQQSFSPYLSQRSGLYITTLLKPPISV